MKKNNILVLSYDYYPNNIWGVGKNVYDFINSNYKKYKIVLYTALPRKKNSNYELITPHHDLYSIFLKGKCIENNSFRDSNLLNAVNVLMAKKIINYYENNAIQPDIILNHGWMTWQIADIISNKYKIKIISFIHFYEKQFLLSNNSCSKTDWNDIYKIERNMFDNSSKLVVFSDNQKNELSKLYDINIKKINVIHHSIQLPNIFNVRRSSNIIKILFVGRLVRDKGIEELLIVFNRLLKSYSNLQLTVVGDGVLKSSIEKNKKVVCTGWLEGDKLYQKYIENDIFCFPTKSETFGMVLIEAMKYKIPIITTEGNTVSNIISNNKTGLTIKLKESSNGLTFSLNDLYKKLEMLIKDKKLRDKLSSAAYNEYINKYYDSEIDKTNDLIEVTLKNA